MSELIHLKGLLLHVEEHPGGTFEQRKFVVPSVSRAVLDTDRLKALQRRKEPANGLQQFILDLRHLPLEVQIEDDLVVKGRQGVEVELKQAVILQPVAGFIW